MRVLIVSRGYPTEKYPMNGVFEFDQAKALSSVGCEVILVSLDMRSLRRWRKWGFNKFKLENIWIYEVNIPLGRVFDSVLSFFRNLGLKQIYNLIVKDIGIPDIIHAHFSEQALVAANLSAIINIPVVMTEHYSGLINEPLAEKTINLAQKTYPRMDEIITVSPALKKVLKKQFDLDSIYIANVLDTDSFFYSPNRSEKKFVFVAVGGLILRKRMDLIISSFAKAFKNNLEVELIIIGSGPEEQKLNKLVKDFHLGGRVKLTGRLQRYEISKIMNKSNCFVLPSRAETFGVVYIEAMMTGLPIIATKCGGPEGFISETNGLLIDVDSEEQLIKAMLMMYNHREKYDSEKISRETRKLFSPVSIAREIVTVYENVISERLKNNL